MKRANVLIGVSKFITTAGCSVPKPVIKELQLIYHLMLSSFCIS